MSSATIQFLVLGGMLIATLLGLFVLSVIDRREDARYAEIERNARHARAMRARAETRPMRVRQRIPVMRPIKIGAESYWLK